MKVQRFTYDMAIDNTEPPQPGDRLFGAKAQYEVIEARPVESRVWPNRWALTVKRCEGTTPQPGARAHSFRRYRRGERPAAYFNSV